MTGVLEDTLSILRMLLDHPSSLGKKRLTELQLEGWRLLSSPVDSPAYLEQVKSIIFELYPARKLKKGGQLGNIAPYYLKNDQIVINRIAAGESTKAAITAVYGDDQEFGNHKKRINRRKAELKKLAEIVAVQDKGDIEPPENRPRSWGPA